VVDSVVGFLLVEGHYHSVCVESVLDTVRSTSLLLLELTNYLFVPYRVMPTTVKYSVRIKIYLKQALQVT
jgi:hypothetical protein